MKNYTVRLPDDLHAGLVASAKSNARSLHLEILFRLADPVRVFESERLRAKRTEACTHRVPAGSFCARCDT